MRQATPTKQAHRAIFLAIQADAKEYPGGIQAIAATMGINGHTLANGLNPNHDCPPPPFGVVLEVVMLAQAKRGVAALARLVDQVTMDFELEQRHPAEAVTLFLGLLHTVGEVMATGSNAAKDGRFDAGERAELEPLLLALMKASGELLQAVRAG